MPWLQAEHPAQVLLGPSMLHAAQPVPRAKRAACLAPPRSPAKRAACLVPCAAPPVGGGELCLQAGHLSFIASLGSRFQPPGQRISAALVLEVLQAQRSGEHYESSSKLQHQERTTKNTKIIKSSHSTASSHSTREACAGRPVKSQNLQVFAHADRFTHSTGVCAMPEEAACTSVMCGKTHVSVPVCVANHCERACTPQSTRTTAEPHHTHSRTRASPHPQHT